MSGIRTMNSMRSFFLAVFFILAVICRIVTAASAQSQHPVPRTLKLTALRHSPKNCYRGIEARFLDNESLLISNPICAKSGVYSGYQIAIAGLDGTIRASIDLDDNSRHPYAGPPGYTFITSVDFYDLP